MTETKNAIVVSLNPDISEILDLTKSNGYSVKKVFIQNKKPHVKYYIGAGKVDEIKEFVDEYEESIDIIVVNGKLKPSQWFELEKKLEVSVLDRVNLILDIFEKRADRKEPRLQVKLARLEYQKSFVRELINRSKAGEHPGFMAGGEYQVDDYYENIKSQTKKIKKDLENIRKERNIRRRHRHISGFYIVSLAGYTNAGKSSLLNYLSDETVKVEDKLFSTLSTTTRRINSKNVPILLTDTVGFIENLPALIIDAFHSTLEEIKRSDIVILVLDFSEDKEIIKKKLDVCIKELYDLGVESTIIVALNKIDLLSREEIKDKMNFVENLSKVNKNIFVLISVNKEKNVDNLLENLYKSLPKLEKYTLKLPINDKSQTLISKIYEKTNVLDINYSNYVTVSFESSQETGEKLISNCKKINGKVLD